MQCPDCGYVLGDFDKECVRCQKLAARLKPCLKCGTASPATAALCQKCGHRFGEPADRAALPTALPRAAAAPLSLAGPPAAEPPSQSFAPQTSSPQPVQAPASAPPLTPEMLACRVCGGNAAQKVSAVVRAGSWVTESRGSFIGAGSDGQGHMMMVGGPTHSTSRGQTGIAALLAPPARPRLNTNQIGTFAIPIIGYGFALIVWAVLGTSGALAVTIITAIVSTLWAFVWNVEGTNFEGAQVRHRGDMVRWEQGMQTWNRLFYCPRCDHVFDAQTGSAAPPHGAGSLVYADAPPPGVLYLEPTSERMTRAGITAAAVAAIIIVPAWVGYAADYHAGQDLVQSRTAAIAPLTRAFSAAQGQIQTDLSAAQTAAASANASAAGFNAGDSERSAALSELASASASLRQKQGDAQEALDEIGKASDGPDLSARVQEAQSAITEMKTAQAQTEQYLGEMRRIPLTAPTPTAPPAYSITTAGGGAAPPDTSTFSSPSGTAPSVTPLGN